MSTSFAKGPGNDIVQRKWILIDAEGVVLGRLAVIIANILRGKNKSFFTPHVDCGDHVIVVNADKVKLTGNKLTDKFFYWHTGYPGGIKKRNMKDLLSEAKDDKVVHNAVRRMISKGPLRSDIMKKLKVYKGGEHPHGAQAPEILDVAALNSKNKRSSGK
ncbi:MAG: 50S ribosomal protein L13 [Holosporales bacterium]|jgi:large subunit ribosomal protein L13|nr:50S ribosomal protein L13 [Holosporales bacterium]